MATKVTRLFCTHCNPQRVHQEDRRETAANLLATVLPFSSEERRAKADRRQVLERRQIETLPSGMLERRQSKGRRPFDGYTWFEGCLDDAIRTTWLDDTVVAFEYIIPDEILCPKCRKATAKK